MVLKDKKDVKVKKCTLVSRISGLLLHPTIILKMNKMMLRFSDFSKYSRQVLT